MGEERLTDDRSSGQFDFYDNGVLWDTKTWGSYKIMKALGMYQLDVPTGEIYKTGEKKGQEKTRKEWREGGRKDRLEVAVQMNDYRMKLEALGFPVHAMIIEALARDGGCYIAKNRGVEQNGALIPINKISDRWITSYMDAKRRALLDALEMGKIPPVCRPRERWRDRKCKDYCNTNIHCSHGMKFLKEVV